MNALIAPLLEWLAGEPILVQAAAGVVALAGLWAGSEVVIVAGRVLARRFGVSDLIVGLTIVSVASSLPEIFVNISAALKGEDSVAFGNVVGSCQVQITLILGLTAVFAGRLSGGNGTLIRDGVALVFANAAVFYLGQDGRIDGQEGFGLIAAYIFYLLYVLMTSRGDDPDTSVSIAEDDGVAARAPALVMFLGIVFSILFVWFLSEILVAAGVSAGEKLGASREVIGLWTGVGTSMPELAISFVAVFRRSGGISLGNLIGSNITDPLLSLGLGAAAGAGLSVSDFLLWTATPLWFAATLFTVVVLWSTRAISRVPGFVLVFMYVASQWYLLR